MEIFIPWHKAYAIRCKLMPIMQATMRPPLPMRTGSTPRAQATVYSIDSPARIPRYDFDWPNREKFQVQRRMSAALGGMQTCIGGDQVTVTDVLQVSVWFQLRSLVRPQQAARGYMGQSPHPSVTGPTCFNGLPLWYSSRRLMRPRSSSSRQDDSPL